MRCGMTAPLPSQMVGTGLKERYWHVIEDKYPSKKEEGLTAAIARLVDLYAVLYMAVGTFV